METNLVLKTIHAAYRRPGQMSCNPNTGEPHVALLPCRTHSIGIPSSMNKKGTLASASRLIAYD